MKNRSGFLIFIATLLLLWYLGGLFRIDTNAIARSLEGIPVFYRFGVFITLYVCVTFFVWFSKDLFRIMAAVMFGAYGSTLCIFIAEAINACLLFYFARSLGRGFVEEKLRIACGPLHKRIAGARFSWLFILRAVPLVPFRFLDLLCGVTGISFKRYMAAVLFGSPLRIFWLQFILAGVGEAVFNKPEALPAYLSQHGVLLSLSFFYAIAVFLVAFRIRQKG